MSQSTLCLAVRKSWCKGERLIQITRWIQLLSLSFNINVKLLDSFKGRFFLHQNSNWVSHEVFGPCNTLVGIVAETQPKYLYFVFGKSHTFDPETLGSAFHLLHPKQTVGSILEKDNLLFIISNTPHDIPTRRCGASACSFCISL